MIQLTIFLSLMLGFSNNLLADEATLNDVIDEIRQTKKYVTSASDSLSVIRNDYDDEDEEDDLI